MKEKYKQKNIADLVAEDYRHAGVFKKYGIDFCCGGKRPLEEVCESKGINPDELIDMLIEAEIDSNVSFESFNDWPLDKLTDHIIRVHHGYCKESIPMIKEYAEKVARVHGHASPEVIEIRNLFNEAADELTIHMQKEEIILFPSIKNIVEEYNSGKKVFNNRTAFLQGPITVMENDHDLVGEIMKKISALSSNYNPPEYACNTYRVLYFKLQEFEDDLHLHIHLENNILFPNAIKMENSLCENQ